MPAYRFTPRFGIWIQYRRDWRFIRVQATRKSCGRRSPGSVGILYASRTSFNLLLVDNHDKGSLNSEFCVRYFVNDKVTMKLIYQHLFSEFITRTKVQQLPEPNDRFRY